MRRLKVAAVQVESENGGMQRNLARASPFVEDAARQGAELVLCPEFLAAGYVFDESIWASGETKGGATESWLEGLSRRLGIYVGATYLEAEGEDFFNTFTLMAPGGKLAGRVRKRSLPFFEGWFFRPSSGSKVIDTELGRLGVGICNDTQTAAFLSELDRERPDLLLMPHSAPTPSSWLVGGLVMRGFDERLSTTPGRYARALGIPALLCNKVAKETTETPLPGVPLVRVRWRFRGLSSVCDSNGEVLASLQGREGVVMGEVTLDPARKRQEPLRPVGYWSFPPAHGARAAGAMLTALEHAGQAAYRSSRKRRAAALALSSSEASTS